MRYFFRFLIVTLLLCGITACSSNNADLKPAPLTSFKATLYPDFLWTHSVPNGAEHYYLQLTPAVDNRRLFVAAYDGVLQAVDLQKNARVIWQTHIKWHYSSGVAAADGKLFVATTNGQLLSIEQKDGHLLWTKPTSSQVLATPVVADGKVLVHAIDGTLTAYAEDTGRQLWQHQESVPDLILHLSSQPKVSGPYVVCGFANGKVMVLNLADGKVLWTHQVAEPKGSTVVERMVDVDLSPVVQDGVVYVAGYQGNLVALNLIDGSVLWHHAMSAYAGLAYDKKAIYLTDSSGNVWAFDQSTGQVLWKQNKLARRGLTAPVMADDVLVMGDEKGYLHFLSSKNGKFLARKHVALSPIITDPIYHDGTLYAYAQSGRLVAYKL